MMAESIDTYCPHCDLGVRAALESRHATLAVRGEDVEFIEDVAVCPRCGREIGDARIEGENLERAYASYRSRHGILSPHEIRALRTFFGLSLREFSRFLGFGEQTVYRYEHGDIPDQTHGITLESAKSLEGASLLLARNRGRLSARSISSVEQALQALRGQIEPTYPYSALDARESVPPSSKNGFRPLDSARVLALVHLLAQKCSNLYWTKLQKALFFADMISFERRSRSLTGLAYAHATYGPVVDRREELRRLLLERGVATFEEHEWGEVLNPLPYNGAIPFDSGEIELIDVVADFVNTFTTSSDLSNFSHRLSCWKQSADGQIIDYSTSNGEIDQAMKERLSQFR